MDEDFKYKLGAMIVIIMLGSLFFLLGYYQSQQDKEYIILDCTNTLDDDRCYYTFDVAGEQVNFTISQFSSIKIEVD
jgi:hypothetical protein